MIVPQHAGQRERRESSAATHVGGLTGLGFGVSQSRILRGSLTVISLKARFRSQTWFENRSWVMLKGRVLLRSLKVRKIG